MKHKYTKDYFKKYGSTGEEYEKLADSPTFRKSLQEIIDLKYNGKLLDIGCAKGYFLRLCQAKKFEVYGVDISKYIVNQAKKLLGTSNIYALDLSVDKLPFKSGSIDIVTFLDSLEHIENPQNALREVKRVLRKRGLIHIRLPGFERGLTEVTHVNYYNTKSLEVLLEKYQFRIIKIGDEGGILQIPLGILRLITRSNTNFNFVPYGGKFISCYAIKL